MMVSLLALALLPSTLLASSKYRAAQDVIGFQAAPPDTLAKANVNIYNGFPVEATLFLNHWRGEDDSTRADLRWDGVASEETSSNSSIQFSTARRDWDRWQAGVKFRKTDSSLWTKQFYFSLFLDEPRIIPFAVTMQQILGLIGERHAEELFELQGSDFPTSAIGINSFFFLRAQHSFAQRVSIEVELETRSNTWKQTQKLVLEPGEAKEPVAFFFEKNSTKPYVELFQVKVAGQGGKPGKTRTLKCEIGRKDAGQIAKLKLNDTGLSITTGSGAVCDGKWQA